MVPMRRGARHDDMSRLLDARLLDAAIAGLNFGNSSSDTTSSAGAAILEHEAVIVLGHQRVDRNGDHPGLDGAEKRGRPIDSVEQANEDAFFGAHAKPAQHVAEALDTIGEIGIAVFAAMIDESDPVGAAGIEIAL